MKISRLSALLVVLAISLSTVLSSFPVLSVAGSLPGLVVSDVPESHVIEGVPYIGQETDVVCSYCCDVMCFQYYGADTNLNELLYLSGAAYSSANHPLLKSRPVPPIKFTCFPGFYLGLMDYKFYASLYGMSEFDWQPKNRLNEKKCWSEYWSKIKYYISNDVPIVAFIDARAWPIYKTYHNLPTNPFFKFGNHVILIVGYNETNRTICYNDPGALLLNQPEKEGYAWEDLTAFRKAVRVLGDESYLIAGYEKTSEPLSKEMRFEVAYERNIEKMKGNQSIYYEFNKDFRNYGINAIKSLKKEFLLLNKSIPLTFYCLKEIILQRLLDGGDFFHKLWATSRTNYIMKHNVSEYLLENQDISPICKYDGDLLESESKCWKDINSLVTELNEIYKTNGLLRSMKLSKPLINNITILLDNVISIEQAIIDGPAEN